MTQHCDEQPAISLHVITMRPYTTLINNARKNRRFPLRSPCIKRLSISYCVSLCCLWFYSGWVMNAALVCLYLYHAWFMYTAVALCRRKTHKLCIVCLCVYNVALDLKQGLPQAACISKIENARCLWIDLHPYVCVVLCSRIFVCIRSLVSCTK